MNHHIPLHSLGFRETPTKRIHCAEQQPELSWDQEDVEARFDGLGVRAAWHGEQRGEQHEPLGDLLRPRATGVCSSAPEWLCLAGATYTQAPRHEDTGSCAVLC